MSMLNPKLERDLYQDVLPWLMSQKEVFTVDQIDAAELTSQIISVGIQNRVKVHAKTMADRAKRLRKEAEDLANAGARQEQRRAERKIAREIRAKEATKAKLQQEIRKMLIDKGTVISPAFGAELLDIHGCYEKGKQFLGALGGEIQQIYFVINAIVTKFAKTSDLAEYFARVAEDPKQESLKHAKTPRELLLENFFLPFMLTFLKELKHDDIKFLITPELDALISSFKLPKNAQDTIDFTRMNNEQYIAFRHAFVEERMYHPIYKKNKGHHAMEIILTSLCIVLCNRVPKGVVPFRVDQLISKIKLVYPPKGIEAFARTNADGVVIPKNTNERAVVRILVPKRTMTLSEYNHELKENQQEEDEANRGEHQEEAERAKSSLETDKRSNVNKSGLSRVPSEKVIETD